MSKLLEMLTTLASSSGMIARLSRLRSTEAPSLNREEPHCDVVKI